RGLRVTESLDSREVLKPSVGLLAEEGLVHTEGVCVPVEECDRLFVAFQFLGENLDILVVSSRLWRLWRAEAAKKRKIELLRARGPVGLETWICLKYQHETSAGIGPYPCKSFLHPSYVRGLAFDMLSIHFGRSAEIVIAADDVHSGEGHSA